MGTIKHLKFLTASVVSLSLVSGQVLAQTPPPAAAASENTAPNRAPLQLPPAAAPQSIGAALAAESAKETAVAPAVEAKPAAETVTAAPSTPASDTAASAPAETPAETQAAAPVAPAATAPLAAPETQAPTVATQAAPANAGANGADTGWEQEFALWQAAASGNTIEEYNGYLTAYPTGKFATIAKARIVKLVDNEAAADAQAAQAAPVEPAFSTGTPDTEAALLSERATRREVQGRLTSIGFATGGVDGALGAKSRNAIMQWQGFVDAPATGYISYDQLARLRTDSEQPYQSWLAAQPKPRPARVRARPAAGDELVGRVPDNSGADAAIALGVLGLAAGVIGGAAISNRHRHHGPRYYRGHGRPFRHHR
ncbi:peptidoglycan hydrolase-like protein with peptidoglycan-binding domain [Neorhizobium huautlense]|uniref:Peptidoglycan hydrolase-like protein with peptidoglycan-binding domain n=1 Tax=Neorhizobium huautlense TaxID=67774 RepID=A0ABT9PX01_9HYPH|nr:peptidoglycan-binding domain-containing protein [Neorhizobium huautlense]MDP9838284.1 peptidoglycan hydrolase-like protein with peptidoglycan-binding domain [Neorhizobium huautlense]